MLESVQMAGTAFATQIMASELLCYGVAPVVAGALGIILPYLLVEILKRIGVLNASNAIEYGTKETREVALKTMWSKISHMTQLSATLWTSLGPSAIANGFLSYKLFPYIFPALESLPVVPGWETFLKQFLLMQLVGDLGLYIGHRVQHESEFLWKHCHSLHHSIGTPSVASTAYIHPVDMTLQTALPMMIAAVLVRAHPISFIVYILVRVGESSLNHCGHDSWVLNALTLKLLPFRASVRHHDEHHRYSNYARNAKNYGENFVIWDWLFGSLRQSTSASASAKKD